MLAAASSTLAQNPLNVTFVSMMTDAINPVRKSIDAPTRPRNTVEYLAKNSGMMPPFIPISFVSVDSDATNNTKPPTRRRLGLSDSDWYIRQAVRPTRTGNTYADMPIAWINRSETYAPTGPIQL